MGKLSLAHTSINFLAMVISTRLPKASEHFKDNRIITATTTRLPDPASGEELTVQLLERTPSALFRKILPERQN